MLAALHLVDTGPGRTLDLELAPRLNVLTGDNGLGKSFVLDVIWWALTEVWGGYPAGPYRAPGQKLAAESHPTITWSYRADGAVARAQYHRAPQRWEVRAGTPPPAGPIVYARADGSISVCDPLREGPGGQRSPRGGFVAWTFDERSLWSGVKSDGGEVVCRGLLEDWVTWRLMHAADQESPYPQLEEVLAVLSPHESERLRLGEPTRVYRNMAQDIPVLRFEHADVPVIHASTGMRRILALAYMLIWTWTEHRRAASLAGVAPNTQLVLLLDEVEAHLHPQWQRRILPALLRAVQGFWGEVAVQVVVTTHAPLVLASLEPHFRAEMDALFRFEVQDGRAVVERQVWAKQGDAVNWLVSPNFGLEQARSVEAERAIEAAKAYMRGEVAALPEGLRTAEAIDAELRRVLPYIDQFWPRWFIQRHCEGAL